MPQIAHFPFYFDTIPGVSCVFTTRLGGISNEPFDAANLSFEAGDSVDAVIENREALQQQLDFAHWGECHQVHGTELQFNPKPTRAHDKPVHQADGMATIRKNQALVIKTADCQPVLLAHRSGNIIAALHVGWRGNVANYPFTAIRRICDEYRLQPRDFHAVRGPSLGPLRAEFTNFDKEFGTKFKQFYDRNTGCVDLWALTRYQLLAAGVPDENIHGVDLCTNTMTDTFYSYRAAPAPERKTGRQMGLIWMREER
ncbi:purine nucleoside phosphorylase YfiH/LACC1 family protein [Salidesulfovibrio brasiliensis]|uniref:polyphenol oxidase family protein n=1 Tax=Salidesulfovibrio brasiliensis TaxID=221711 RepID=UPI0006CFE2F6|nr:polyphenol oxidase family protein [Salidesulfovibrio brasiliensis]